MPYTVLSDRDIKDWNTDYQALAQKLADEADPTEKEKLETEMQKLGTRVEEHLNQVGRQIRAYYDQHSAKVDNWLRLSEQAIANARKAAATYKKDTSTGVPPLLQQAAADMTLYVQAITTDAQEFGAAWFAFRSEMANHIPAKYQDSFKALRSKVMNDQKAITVTKTKIQGYVAEAEGLVKVAAKAGMKAGIKAGTGVQRPIAEAQQDARDLAAQVASELNLLRNPPGTATAPMSVTTTMESVRANSKDKTYTNTTANAILLAGRKKILENGVQLMRTRAASMEKVLATKTKAFRSNELSDATVKAEIKKAQKSLQDAKVELKNSEADAKKGLDAIAVIEKRWATKAK